MNNQKNHNQYTILKSSWLTTTRGSMLAIASKEALYLLEFAGRRDLEQIIKDLTTKTNATILPGRTRQIDSIEHEINAYFAGSLKEFKTPIHLSGSPFQQDVWHTLMSVPYGNTISYSEQAIAMGKQSTACRAVANANGANHLAIIIPCHRIINTNGNLGGYGGGIAHKQWLINHEKRNRT
jgi:AraC family transcriptional regulator of adaptative response/methylated-DNA-[protein]-cysteine methyltransferase